MTSIYDEGYQAAQIKPGIRMVVYAQEKMGKTTFATAAPDAVLIPLEQGYADVDTSKVLVAPMVKTLPELYAQLQDIYKRCADGTFPKKSVVFDSVTALERIIYASITEAEADPKHKTMNAAMGGYGKAYDYAMGLFTGILDGLDHIVTYHGINVIFTAHAFSAKHIDPSAGEFDIWDILLHSPKNSKTYGFREVFTQWVDICGFMHDNIIATEQNGIQAAAKVGEERAMSLTRAPAYVAGNRFKMTGDLVIPLEGGWNVFANALYAATNERINVYNHSA